MAFDWLNHTQLQIIKGIGKTPGDNFSAEADPVVVNLLSGPITLQDWSPNIPATKNGGVWTESPLSDGRQLLAAAAGNVTEKITILIADASYLTVNKALSGLGKMALNCRDFWQSGSQIDPVYLLWNVSCGAGPQYALLSNIEIAPEYQASMQPSIRVSLSLEREPYWRGIPPGANPKLWTLSINNTQPTITNVALTSQTNDLVYDGAVTNRYEWDPTSYSSPISKNYIDIPASLIPGDAPALVSLVVSAPVTAVGALSNLFVARSIRPVSLKDRTGATVYQSLVLNAGDAVGPTNWTKTLDATCGCISNGSAVNKYIGSNAALATGTYNQFAQWSKFGSNRFVDPTLMNGRFACFWRCKQLNGAVGDVQARVALRTVANTFLGSYNNLPLIAAAGAGCIDRFDLLYMGLLTIPLEGDVGGGVLGRGLNVFQKTGGDATFEIDIDVKQNNVAARSLQFLDLILMPVNECFVQMTGYGLGFYDFDNTGYLAHGKLGVIAKQVNVGSSDTNEAGLEIRGPELILEPKVNNRLYFITQRQDAALINCSAPESTLNDYSVRVNIVPRWAGIRDS